MVRGSIPGRKVSSNRDALEAGLSELGFTILGAAVPRLPNTSFFLIPNADSEMVVHQLLAVGFSISNGSACSLGSDRPSHVVLAMGVDYSAAAGAIRVSLCQENTGEKIALLIDEIRRFYS
jgi:cysteine desulfurase